MNRRIVYKEQAKCNFCYNWFQVFSQIKFGLNICEACIYKALNTSCFKLPTPQGHLYQVYLARRNISVNPSNQSILLQKIDQFMHAQIRELLEKWEQITKILKGVGPNQGEEEIWRRTEFILKNDSKNFNVFNSQTIEQIREDVIGRQKTDRKHPCTPMRQKGINMSIKYLNKSNKKLTMNRMDSKKSLRSFRDVNPNDKSANKIQIQNDKQNVQDDYHRRNDTSPFSLAQIKRVGSTRGLNITDTRQNKEFIAKMQLIKNNISANLQQRSEVAINEPINILKQRIYEAIQNTNCINKCIEVVSYNGLQSIDMKCYLNNLEWDGVEVVKFVKVGLTDEQLQIILQFIKDKSVQTLVLTSNNLTEQSCRNLLKSEVKSLHNIYLGKNQIFSHKAKNEIKQLKSKYNFFL